MSQPEIVRRSLARLLEEAVRPVSAFTPSGSVRSGWIMIPDGESLAAVETFPLVPAYALLRKHFRVPYWREAEVERLLAQLHEIRATYAAGSRRHAAEEQVRQALRKAGSVTGYSYSYPGLHVYPDLADCPYSCDESKYLPPEERERLRFRSKAVIRLDYEDRPVGVLLLCDSVIGGFRNSSKNSIELLAQLAAPFVAHGIALSCFEPAQRA